MILSPNVNSPFQSGWRMFWGFVSWEDAKGCDGLETNGQA